ncbi:MAG: hypothetical protein EOP49_24020 [Sphingobacteriales bacterium]|nr:MAG: hypothetical protein EOP49_24020 [Sphingobacteriales bacterium]
MKPNILLASCLASILFSCTKQETVIRKEQDGLHQAYHVTFDKTANSIAATATFRKGGAEGPAVTLDGTSAILLNNVSHTFLNVVSGTYKWQLNGLSDARFDLIRKGRPTVSNTISQGEIGIVNFDGLPGTISKSKGVEFAWAGTPVKTNQEVSVSVVSGNRKIDRKQHSGRFRLTPVDLQTFQKGHRIRVKLIKTGSVPLVQQDSRGGGTISYSYTVEREVLVAE